MSRLRVAHLRLLVPFVILAWVVTLPIGDNSFLWHVRAGTLQLDTGSVLRSDPFSFTALGEAWRTQSWLAELGYGWLERATGGIAWVPIMKFIVMSLTLVLLGLVINRIGNGRHWLTLGAVFLFLWQAAPFGLARPALFGFLFLAVAVAVVNTPQAPLWVLPPLFWLWGSVHGMFAIGLGYLFLDGLAKRSRKQMIAVAISTAATALTAHGLGVWWIVAQFLRNTPALDLMSEWQPPDFANPFLLPMVIVIAGVIAAGTLGRLRIPDLWVVIPFMAFGLIAERNVWPAVIVLGAYAFRAFPPSVRSQEKPAGESTIVNWVIAALLVAVSLLGLLRPTELAENRFPSTAALAALDDGAVFHGSGVGGYLIYAEWPERLVFIDDRAELYGELRIQQFQDARYGIGVEETFAAYGIDQALIPPDWPLGRYLDLLGWRYEHVDDHFVVIASP